MDSDKSCDTWFLKKSLDFSFSKMSMLIITITNDTRVNETRMARIHIIVAAVAPSILKTDDFVLGLFMVILLYLYYNCIYGK